MDSQRRRAPAPAAVVRPTLGARWLAASPPMRYGLTLIVVAVVAATVTHLPLAVDSPGYRIGYHLVAAAGLAMVVAGSWRDRARLHSVGLIVAVAVCLQFGGDIGTTVRLLGGGDRTWPYWTDPIFLVSYVALCVAVLLTVHRRAAGHDGAALVDAAMSRSARWSCSCSSSSGWHCWSGRSSRRATS